MDIDWTSPMIANDVLYRRYELDRTIAPTMRLWCHCGRDPPDFALIPGEGCIEGRGVRTLRNFAPGEFLMKYYGVELAEEAEGTEYTFGNIYHCGRHIRYDASEEDDQWGRLVNNRPSNDEAVNTEMVNEMAPQTAFYRF